MFSRQTQSFDFSRLFSPLLLLWLAQFVFMGTATPFLHSANCPDSIGYRLGKQSGSGQTASARAAQVAENPQDCAACALLHASHGVVSFHQAHVPSFRFISKPLLSRDEVVLVSAFSHRAIARGPPRA